MDAVGYFAEFFEIFYNFIVAGMLRTYCIA